MQQHLEVLVAASDGGDAKLGLISGYAISDGSTNINQMQIQISTEIQIQISTEI